MSTDDHDLNDLQCEVCSDTGWRTLRCDGDRRCNRRRPHLPHEFAIPCSCRPMNRVYQEKRERTVRAA